MQEEDYSVNSILAHPVSPVLESSKAANCLKLSLVGNQAARVRAAEATREMERVDAEALAIAAKLDDRKRALAAAEEGLEQARTRSLALHAELAEAETALQKAGQERWQLVDQAEADASRAADLHAMIAKMGESQQEFERKIRDAGVQAHASRIMQQEMDTAGIPFTPMQCAHSGSRFPVLTGHKCDTVSGSLIPGRTSRAIMLCLLLGPLKCPEVGLNVSWHAVNYYMDRENAFCGTRERERERERERKRERE
jgi:hypothetical protein